MLNEISLANVLPRKGMKIAQRQLKTFLKCSRNTVRADVTGEVPLLITTAITMVTVNTCSVAVTLSRVSCT